MGKHTRTEGDSSGRRVTISVVENRAREVCVCKLDDSEVNDLRITIYDSYYYFWIDCKLGSFHFF